MHLRITVFAALLVGAAGCPGDDAVDIGDTQPDTTSGASMTPVSETAPGTSTDPTVTPSTSSVDETTTTGPDPTTTTVGETDETSSTTQGSGCMPGVFDNSEFDDACFQ